MNSLEIYLNRCTQAFSAKETDLPVGTRGRLVFVGFCIKLTRAYGFLGGGWCGVRWLWRKAESHRYTPTYSHRATSRDESGATSEDLHPTSLFLVIASAEYRKVELFPLICFK